MKVKEPTYQHFIVGEYPNVAGFSNEPDGTAKASEWAADNNGRYKRAVMGMTAACILSSASPAVEPHHEKTVTIERVGDGYKVTAAKPNNVQRSVIEVIGWLLGDVGLNVTDAAYLFGVGRPTIYSWAKNAEVNVKPEHESKIRRVEKVLSQLPEDDLSSRFFHHRTGEGVRLLDLLKDESENVEKVVNAFLSEIKKRQGERNEITPELAEKMRFDTRKSDCNYRG